MSFLSNFLNRYITKKDLSSGIPLQVEYYDLQLETREAIERAAVDFISSGTGVYFSRSEEKSISEAFLAGIVDDINARLERGERRDQIEATVLQHQYVTRDRILKEHLAREKRARFEAECAAYVSAEIRAGRLSTCEKPDFLKCLLQAYADDESPLLEGSGRVERIKKRQAARRPSGLTEEVLVPDSNFAKNGRQLSLNGDAEHDPEIQAQVRDYVQKIKKEGADAVQDDD